MILPLFLILHFGCTDNSQGDKSYPVICFNSSSFDGGSKYAVTDILDNNTIIPMHSSSNEYGFILTDFPAHNFRPAFIDGFLAGMIQPLDAKEKLSNESVNIPAETIKNILSLTEDDNPVLVLGKY